MWKEQEMNGNGKDWILHLTIRLAAIPLLFMIVYRIILGDKTDPMGYGFVYAFIITTVIAFLYFGVESMVLYRKKQKSKLYVDLFLLAVAALGVLTVFLIL